jgi:hypothetical protein
MVRGAAKQASQAKNQKKQEKLKKNGKSKSDSDNNRAAALKLQCEICKIAVVNYKLLVVHYDSKHPKLPHPADPNAA